VRRGLGGLRLPSGPEAIEILHAAFDAGIRHFDTARSYGGDNERLIGEALRGRDVEIATKGGMKREGPRYVPSARARDLEADCEQSLRALGADSIALYYLHAPDPAVPLETSVRALDRLRERGLVRAIGLCNVNATELRAALEIAEIAAVQVELNPFEDECFRSGVVDLCVERAIRVVAHSPFGGPKRAKRIAKHAALSRVGDKHGVDAYAACLAWLADLSPSLVPIAGAGRIERISSIAAELALDDADRALLDEAIPLGRLIRTRRDERRPRERSPHEVVLVVGPPGAGKSTHAARHTERGYARLNRDMLGGTMKTLVEALDARLREGGASLVLDNTFGKRSVRNHVIETAWAHGLEVRCEWLDTEPDDCLTNAAYRMVKTYGRLLSPEEIKQHAKRDPNTFAPNVIHRHFRELERPGEDEGFVSVERLAFERVPHAGTRAAVLFELDGVLREGTTGPSPTSAGDVVVRPERLARLRDLADDHALLAIAWLPPPLDDARTLERTRELLEGLVEIAACPHPAGPAICWCRKPLPGLAIELMLRHDVDPSRTTYVGRSPHDRTLARRVGVRYVEHDEFFG
jgi:aryl-alcohol dehydrogenase-like predicted oxidoreductase/predicted kinase